MAFPYSSAMQTSLAHVQDSSLMVITYNSTALKEDGDRRHFYLLFFWGQKSFVSGHQIQKSLCLYP